MSTGIIIAIVAVVSLGIGAVGVYLFNKFRKNEKTDEANHLVGESEANDEKRNEIKSKIEQQIEKNKELQEKLSEKLK